MLHRLELPDGAAELAAVLGVLGGHLEAPAGAARALGRGQGEGQVDHGAPVDARQLAVGGHGDLLEADGGQPAGEIEAAHRLDGRAGGIEVDGTPHLGAAGEAGRGEEDAGQVARLDRAHQSRERERTLAGRGGLQGPAAR